MGERIAGEQNKPNLITEGPQGPSNSQKYTFFKTFMKNWLSIVFPYVHTMSPL